MWTKDPQRRRSLAVAHQHGVGRPPPTGACLIELNGVSVDHTTGRVAIFVASAVGYVHNPEAIYSRALAWGLQQRGHYVRMLEERRNPALRETLETVGSQASRAAFDDFPGVLMHSFEPRTGAALMEWLARELSLVELAIVVDGVPTEVARWVANLDHPDVRRVFLSYRPETLTPERAEELELDRYDAIYATGTPQADIDWIDLPVAIAPQDRLAVPPEYLPRSSSSVPPIDVAVRLEEQWIAKPD